MGPDQWDDAGVYQVSPSIALVQSVDFFTPVVDDPFDYGAIAAANALSDVYAMGGKPLTALTLLGMPQVGLPRGVASAMLRGGMEVMASAGVSIVGGHSVRDKELKFGYAVTGTVHPSRVITNAGARVGDLLVLTKPLGTGVLTTALKRGLLGRPGLRQVVDQMRHLNRAAARAMLKAGAHAATDVTGFGLLGHALNIARASRVTVEIDTTRVPAIPGVEEKLESGCYPGGLQSNLDYVSAFVRFEPHVSDVLRKLLADPQTSGGLLIAVAPASVKSLQAALRRSRTPCAEVVGRVLRRAARPLHVV